MAEDLLTTTDAAALTGRAIGTIRVAVHRGALPMVRRSEMGRPLLERQAVLAWNERSTLRSSSSYTPAWQRTGATLAAHQPATAVQLAAVLHLDPGNVRKHLATLAAHGAARRLPSGEWLSLIAENAPGAA